MKLLGIAAAALALAGVSSASALDIRFYPAARVYTYELDGARNQQTVLVQNVAVINDTAAPLTVDSVEYALLAGAVVQDNRTLDAATLDRTGARTQPLQASGMLAALPFQFGGDKLLPANVKLSADRVLDPGEALLIPQQVMSFSGARDALRVRVTTGGGVQDASIAVLSKRSDTVLALPFAGAWTDGAGPSLHTHHRWVTSEEFAHDFVRFGADGRTFRGDGTKFSDYYAYGQPVLAAAAGRVIYVYGDAVEDPSVMQRPGEAMPAYLQRLMADQDRRLSGGAGAIAGNHIIVEVGNREYALYAHLKPGSIRVKAGDAVSLGQPLASVGSSGNSTEPHLHFQLCDGPEPLDCAAIPANFQNIEIYGALTPRQVQSGDVVRNVSPVGRP